MTLEDGCHSLKLECALRELGFVVIGWKCIGHAGLYFIQPFGLPDDPQADLLGFQIFREKRIVRISQSARKALDFALAI